jgi:hypothetical protein
MDDEPKGDFDWVDALAKCTAREMFERLHLEVQSDVATANRLAGTERFKVRRYDGSFVAFICGGSREGSITFKVKDGSIRVSDSKDTEILNATLTLNSERECRLKVDGQERETWQFRKDALERLLFSFVWEG